MGSMVELIMTIDHSGPFHVKEVQSKSVHSNITFQVLQKCFNRFAFESSTVRQHHLQFVSNNFPGLLLKLINFCSFTQLINIKILPFCYCFNFRLYGQIVAGMQYMHAILCLIRKSGMSHRIKHRSAMLQRISMSQLLHRKNCYIILGVRM